MSLRRPYVAALGLAIIAMIVGLAISSSSKTNKPLSNQQRAALETAAVKRLKFPANFVRSQRGCSQNLCFTVKAPPSQVVSVVPSLLRSAGLQPVGSLRAAEPVARLKATHWTTTSSDPMVIACRTLYTSNHTPVSECQDAGRVGETLVNVLVAPYQACATQSCANSPETSVKAWAVSFAQ